MEPADTAVPLPEVVSGRFIREGVDIRPGLPESPPSGGRRRRDGGGGGMDGDIPLKGVPVGAP